MHTLLAQPAPELSPWLIVAAAGAAILLTLILFSPRLLRRRDDAPAAAPDRVATTQHRPSARDNGAAGGGFTPERAVQRDLESLMHEVTEMTRRVGAQLDARAARLEQLIREADQRLKQLDAAQRSMPINAVDAVDAPHAGLDSDGSAGPGATVRLDAAASPAEHHETVATPWHDGPMNGDGAPGHPVATSPGASDDAIDPRHVEIYVLAEQGLSPHQIADRLARPTGEVELILALRPRNRAAVS